MKISYKILWIDDEPTHIEEDRKAIEEFLKEYGIRAEISTVTKLEAQSISRLVSNPELDILLVDYHMEGMDGAELVSKIRETHHVYLPVIFYSASGLEVILKAASKAQLDGVYLAQRDYLTQKFKSVAESLLNKEHTTKRTRGLLMEGVSEIDARFKEIYEHVWEKLLEEDRDRLIKFVRRIIEDRAKDATKKPKKIPDKLKDFSCHMDDKFLSPFYDTNTRWRVVRKMLEFLRYDLGDSKTVLKEFIVREDGDSLNGLRNIYAHKTRKELQEGHSTEKCVQIRQEIHRQLDNIRRIVAGVQ